MAVICDLELSLGALEGMDGFLSATTLPFSNLSNSPLHRVQGRLVAGWLQGRPLLLLLGRVHPHDGFTLSEAGFPSRMCRLLGCRRLLVCTKAVCLSSSSAAVMNSRLENCDTELVIIKDHLNFSGLGGLSALAGQNDPRRCSIFSRCAHAASGLDHDTSLLWRRTTLPGASPRRLWPMAWVSQLGRG